MAYQFPPDVDRLVKEQMAARGYASEDDLLRDALDALAQFAYSREEAEEEYRQTVAAVKEGVADMEAGRIRPLREVHDEARGKKALETQSCDSPLSSPPGR
jgi:Arc/MetJ-type ribon-helix-helix transcriptional regulator